ncbi:MAG: Ig-like domain-containing protein, partial [Coprothermobacterota bacterium]|nr:Ig-like domain-containing protein [Coprothermobacterota bacterium]
MKRRYRPAASCSLLIFVLVGILCLSGCPSPSTQVPAALNSLELSPKNSTVDVGATLQFSAQGKSAQGAVVTVSGLTWSVSNDIGTIDNNGLFRANKAGSCQVRVSANQGQFTAQADLTVQGGASPTPSPTSTPPVIPTLASIEIIPTSANLTVEEILQFAAKGKDSDGKEMALTNLSWAVEGEIGTVDASGLFTAAKAGLGKVTVAAGGKSASAAVKVKDSLVIIPTPTTAVPQPGDKTYTSMLFRFKLGYPADWTLEEKETGSIVLTSPDAQSVIYHFEGENEDTAIIPADVAAYYLEQWGIPQSDVLENTDFTAKNGLDGTRVLFSQTLDGRDSQGLLYVYTKLSGTNMQYSVLEGDGRG